MEKLLLFDTVNTGHRLRYNVALLKVISTSFDTEYVSSFDSKINEELHESNIPYYTLESKLKNYLIRDLSLFIQMLIYAVKKKYRQIHVATLDSLLIALCLLSPILYVLRLRISGTLHWYPHRKVKRLLLGFLIQTKIIKKIVVHGEYMKNLIVQKNWGDTANRIVVIPYPHLHSKEQDGELSEHSEASKLMDETLYARPFLLVFGGLRYDKGLDLLLNAIHPLEKYPFTIFVVGKEDYFSRADLEQFLQRNPVFRNKIKYKTEYIAEHEVAPFFKHCDAVILPYRKVFTGQSGPLTEGVAMGKFIIGPDHGEIGYAIQKHCLGYMFKAEEVQDLTDKILKFIKLYQSNDPYIEDTRKNTYIQQITLNSFLYNYNNFFTGK